MHHTLACQYLLRPGKLAKPGGQIQRRPDEAIRHLDCLTRVEPNANEEGQGRVEGALIRKALLQVDCGAQGLPRRTEDSDRFVALQADDLALACRHTLIGYDAELRRQSGGGFIPKLLGEAGVPADVRK